MLTAILAALHLADPSSLKRALATGIGGAVSIAVVFVSPWLKARGIPTPSEEMQLALVGAITAKVTAYVLQSASRSKAADLAAIGARPAPVGAVNPADGVKP